MKVYPETIKKRDNGDILYDLCIGVIHLAKFLSRTGYRGYRFMII